MTTSTGTSITWTWRHRRDALVTLSGESDDRTAGRLEDLLAQLVHDGVQVLTVDVSGLVGDHARLEEPMTLACRRLWRRQASLYVIGWRRGASGAS